VTDMDEKDSQTPADSSKPMATITELGDQIMEAHLKYGSISTSATIGRMDMPLEEEPRILEIVAMFRLNGGTFLYGRRIEGERAIWERISLSGSSLAVAWFYRELDAEPPTDSDPVESL